MKSRVLWILPVASTAFLGGGETFEMRCGREVALNFRYEGEDRDIEATLVFEGVEALRITYMTSCDNSMLVAYDKLVDLGDTDWLASVQAAFRLNKYPQQGPIRHLMIYFDDGPCYEVICRSFRIDQSQ